MPFQPMNFANIAPQGSPALRGFVDTLSKGMDLGRKPQQLEQDAKQRELANAISEINAKYAEPQAQAGIAHTQAQTNSLGADMALNPFRKALLQAQATSAGSVASKNELIQNLMSRIMGGQQGAQQPQTQQETPMPSFGGGQGVFNPQAQQPQTTQQPQDNQLSYPQAALMSHLLGMGAPKLIDVDGKQIAVTPFGNIPIAEGMNPLQKEITKIDAGIYKDALASIEPLNEQQDILDNAIDIINNTPGIENVIGPANSVLSKWIGTPEEQKALGEIAATSGNFTLAAAKNIKGAFTGRDMGLIESIKPNLNDRFDAFIGKIKALKLMNEVVGHRNKLIAEKISGGVPANQAIEEAKNETDFKKIKPMVANLLATSGTKGAAGAGVVSHNGKKYHLVDGQWRER